LAPMEYLGAWGTLIHEKNLKSKISCQTPFKERLQNRGLRKWSVGNDIFILIVGHTVFYK